jgi:hypothetical protein
VKDRIVLWLRIGYWAGALLDFIAAFIMVFPSLFLVINQPSAFQADFEYRYAMGTGTPLMIGWAVLLVWADQKPVERMGVLPITLLVVVGEIAVQIWGIWGGFVPFSTLRLTFVMQAFLVTVFLFSYLNARRVQ